MGIELKPPIRITDEENQKRLLETFVNTVQIAKDTDSAAESKKQEKQVENKKEEPKDDRMQYLIDKWNNEVKEIKDKLSIEDLVFNGFVTTDIELFGGLISITFKSLDYGVVGEILNEVINDNSSNSVIKVQNDHSLTLMCEALVDIKSKTGKFPKLPSSRKEKMCFVRELNTHIANKLLEKYNQFDTAVKLLSSSEEDENILDKIKK